MPGAPILQYSPAKRGPIQHAVPISTRIRHPLTPAHKKYLAHVGHMKGGSGLPLHSIDNPILTPVAPANRVSINSGPVIISPVAIGAGALLLLLLL